MSSCVLNTLIFFSYTIMGKTCENPVVGQPVYPAMFTFGDSLVDNGNNNYLASLARADFPPNGCDYTKEAFTGRFCNGKTLADYIGKRNSCLISMCLCCNMCLPKKMKIKNTQFVKSW